MADETQNVGASADQLHTEGTEHIKSKVEENQQAEVQGSSEGTAAATDAPASAPEPATAPAAESAPVTAPAPASAPEPEPVAAAKPPATNPGADDATAGIAKDAGGVSSAAPVQSPVSSKRKSIVGTLKGFLGMDKKEGAGAASTNENQGVIAGGAAAASSVAGAAVAQATQLAEQTRAAVMGESAPTTGAATAGTEADKGAAAADSAPKDEADTGAAKEPTNENLPDEDTSGEKADKPPQTGSGAKALENREAIPSAGGEKLGDKHWGESKIVPEVPKPATEETGVASADGQPTDEVKENTAKNVGDATAAPAKASGEGEKKEKFFDKVKGKLRGSKKQ